VYIVDLVASYLPQVTSSKVKNRGPEILGMGGGRVSLSVNESESPAIAGTWCIPCFRFLPGCSFGYLRLSSTCCALIRRARDPLSIKTCVLNNSIIVIDNTYSLCKYGPWMEVLSTAYQSM
jgi:hypothetical protein